MLSLQQFYDELEQHDWYYAMSDDPSYYHSGLANIQRLIRIANSTGYGKPYIDLLNAYQSYMFTGEAWGTEKKPKPPRPE